MDKLRIGVLIDPSILNLQGGAYSYQKSLAEGIDQFDFSELLEFSFISIYSRQKPKHKFSKPIIFIKLMVLGKKATKKPIIYKKSINLFIWYLNNASWIRNLRHLVKTWSLHKIEKKIKESGIQLVYSLVPYSFPLDIPMIINHWDIGHRSTYFFPEMGSAKNYFERDKFYKDTLNRAFLILCESESGMKELQNFYPIFSKRLDYLPIFPSSLLGPRNPSADTRDTLKNLGLEREKYFFYPAQFWAHKNHYNLVRAFEWVKIQNQDLKLVLCGFDMGNMDYIKKEIESRGLKNEVIIPGFAEVSLVHELYRNALALVMPTFLGPTNMPLMEAALLDCPVICSDLEGHHEIMGNSAIYFDPVNYYSMGEAMLKVLKPEFNRSEWVKVARIKVETSEFNLEKGLIKLNEILQGLYPLRKTWGN